MIEKRFSAGNVVLVFPSEIVAAGWRKALVTHGETRAIRADRVLSWDHFKEIAIPVKERYRPVSHLIRRAFAESLVEQNREHPFLFRIIEPRYASTPPDVTFGIVRLLPQLMRLGDAGSALPEGIAGDIREITRRYREFLDAHSLFEPSWELRGRVALDRIGYHPVILWPELLEDFHDYRAELAPLVTTISLDGTENTGAWGHGAENPGATKHDVETAGNESAGAGGRDRTPPRRDAETPGAGGHDAAAPGQAGPWRVYETSGDEIRSLFDAIEEDLSGGIALHEIAITAANLESLKPWIEREAARRDVPLRFASGAPVPEQPGGSLFRRLDEVIRHDFDVTAVASLLFDRSVPWVDPDVNAALVRFGYEAHCYGDREWERAFSIVEDLPDTPKRGFYRFLGTRYRRLRNDVAALRSASDPPALRNALRRFLDHFVPSRGDSRWDDPMYRRSERVYETALRDLAGVLEAHERGIPVRKPWRFFLTALGEHRYVPQVRGEAIAVYPYRVAAGLPVPRHYVIGLSQSDTRIRTVAPIGFRVDEFRTVGGGAEDRTIPFLRAYGQGMGNTVCSSARTSPSGAHVPAPELGPPVLAPKERRDTLWDEEARWWRGADAGTPRFLYRRQRRGLARALKTTLSPVTASFQDVPIPSEIAALLPLPTAWSPTSIDRFQRCPFSFFVRTILKVEEGRWGFSPTNPMLTGTLLHRVLARVAAADDSTSISRIVETVFSDPEAQLFLPRIGAAGRTRSITASIATILENDAVGLRRSGLREHRFHGEIGGIPVTGTADRIIDDGETVTIIDYKTRVRPQHGPTRVLPVDPPGPEASSTVQLPLYALLHETTFGPFDPPRNYRLLYVDITDATVQRVADRDGGRHSREAAARLPQFISSLPRFLGDLHRAVREGEFMCHDDPGCPECGMRSICRRCFVTRRFSDGA
ncbi:MAG: PD-(D/E)XK nuclease family protein [Alkalispirochaeta sp.]